MELLAWILPTVLAGFWLTLHRMSAMHEEVISRIAKLEKAVAALPEGHAQDILTAVVETRKGFGMMLDVLDDHLERKPLG